MKSFASLLAFSEHIAKVAVAEELLVRKAVNHCAKMVQKEAKREIGKYQEQVGPFIGWPDLTEATKADRVRQGYTENDPLLRSGDMRDSIGYALSTDGMEARIGSNDDKAVYQELGARHIPPRSFLGGAMARKEKDIQKILGDSVFAALVGREVVGGAMPVFGEPISEE